jgi:hypothetical protein
MSLNQKAVMTCSFVLIFIWSCDTRYAGNNISGTSVATSNTVMAIHLMFYRKIELGRSGHGRNSTYLALTVFSKARRWGAVSCRYYHRSKTTDDSKSNSQATNQIKSLLFLDKESSYKKKKRNLR